MNWFRELLVFSLLTVNYAFSPCNDLTIFPRTKERICTVQQDGRIMLGSGCDNDIDYCDDCKMSLECQAIAGMNLKLQCEPPTELNEYSVEIYKGNTRTNGSSILIIDSVQLLDGGQYECRMTYNNGNRTSVCFNVTISTDAVLGVNKRSCVKNFDYDNKLNCCSTHNGIELSHEIYFSGILYAYNVKNISIRQKWLSPPSYHYHNDVGLTIFNFHSSQYQIKVTKYPVFVTSHDKLRVLSIVSITDYQTQVLSLCLPLYIQGPLPILQVNESLPVNSTVYEGEVATFDLKFESQARQCGYFVNVEYSHKNQIVFNKIYEVCSYLKDHHFSNTLYNINISVTGLDILKIFQYRFAIVNASIADNDSIVSFSIINKEQIQWQRNGTLFVQPLLTHVEHKDIGLAKIMTAIFVILTTLAITIVISCLLFYIHRKQKNKVVEPDRVPLTNEFRGSQSSDSECNTPVSEKMQLSVRQVVEYTGPQRAIITTDAWRDNDQGYNSDQESNLNYTLTKRPTSLEFKSKRMLQPNFQYTDPSIAKEKHEENCTVYISYTEEKSGWVYDYLKPLLESWKCQVILHDEDMIPGYTVSGERQRLILQAHRVILVVSKDYSSSPWCLYELQHAITKEPVLFKGRIIPIMVDGCLVMPILVKGIVPLFDFSKNFEVKLKMNICGTT